jgi:hypothetical protein
MGKKSKNKRQQSEQQQRQSSGRSTTQKYFTHINNILITIVLLILFYVVYQSVSGYQFVVDRLVLANLKIIKEYPKISTQKKYEAKLGFDYNYVQYVKKNTPEDAVILMPSREIFEKGDFNTRGAWGVKTKEWGTYFLYPRIIVTEEDSTVNPQLYEKITHIMIVNEWGYDKLEYPVQTKHKHAVLPIINN